SLGRFLLGFGEVIRQEPAGLERSRFANDDANAGLLVFSQQHDVNSPLVDCFERAEYDDVSSFGINWKLLSSRVTGWMTHDSTQQITERTDYTQYENEVCPSLAIKDTGQGILTTAKTRAAIPGWQRALHCLEASVVLTGTHSDASLNFRYEAALDRNSAGLVRKVESVVGADRLTLQEVFYNPDFTVDRISVPGRGSTVLEYQPGTRLLQRKTAPDFMVTEVLERDPVSDAVLAMETDRGLRRYRQFFRYD